MLTYSMSNQQDEEQQRAPFLDGKMAQDGTVDFYGRPPIASKTGGSCRLVTVVILMFMVLGPMSLYGVSYNLVLFMVSNLGLSSSAAASQVSIWTGVHDLSPLLVAYVSDVHLGRFWTTVAASAVYASGMVLLAASVLLIHTQVALRWLFFIALYMVALGKGFVASVLAFGADQFDRTDEKEAAQKSSFFNWYYFCVSSGLLIAVVGVVYVSDRYGFGSALLLCSISFLIGIATFFVPVKYYRYSPLKGNPFARLFTGEYSNSNSNLGGVLLIWLGSVLYEAMRSQTFSLFVEQADLMNTEAFGFRIPPASLNCFDPISVLVWTLIYDRILVPLMRRLTGEIKGFTYYQRMGTGLVVMTMAMACAAIVESSRLTRLENKLSVMWQIPQFAFVGGSKVFYYVGLIEFLYDQVPDNLKTLGTAMSFLSASIGSFLSGFLVSFVSSVTGWIPKDLNEGHLDYFFWLLVVLGMLNWLFFLYCSYTYKSK